MSHLTRAIPALLVTLMVSGACSPEPQTAADVADLIVARSACATADSSAGVVATTEWSDDLFTNQTVIVTDRRARRWYSRQLSRSKADGHVEHFLAITMADRAEYRCLAREDHCSLAPAPAPKDAQRAIWANTDYAIFDDFDKPDHGGAALALDNSGPLAEGAVWRLSVTPPGGFAFIWHVARDGTVVAKDTAPGDGGSSRTRFLDIGEIGGCRLPRRVQQPDGHGGTIELVLKSVEYRAEMTPADTPTEGDVRMP